jgi:hypothetical protein
MLRRTRYAAPRVVGRLRRVLGHVPLLPDPLQDFQAGHPVPADGWGLVCPLAIGDTLFVCGFARAVKAEHGGGSVTIFARPQQQFITTLFSGVDHAVAVGHAVDISKLGDFELRRGRLFHAFFPASAMVNLVGYRGITLLDCYRALLFLPMGTPLEEAAQPSAAERGSAASLLESRGAAPGKTVVLCPEARSTAMMAPIPLEFWTTLVGRLTARGFTCATNLGPRTRCLSGTVPLDIPLSDFRAVALAAGSVVATRSGLCDLAANVTGLRLVVAYPPGRWKGGSLMEGTGLRCMGTNASALELEVFSPAVDAAVDRVLAFLS